MHEECILLSILVPFLDSLRRRDGRFIYFSEKVFSRIKVHKKKIIIFSLPKKIKAK